MRYHRGSFDGGDGLAGGLVTIGIIVMIIAAFLLVKAVVFVIRTCAKYADHTSLRLAVAVWVIFTIVGVLLATQVAPSYSILPVFGSVILLITCVVIDLKNRDTLMRPKVKLVHEILYTPWWGAEDTPQSESQDAQLAA
mgnify:CR=1 FL=1